MAIINCPKCNGKISSSVNQCVHCGTGITVCKECGTAYMTENNACPECGFVDQSASEENLASQNMIGTKELYDAWASDGLNKHYRIPDAFLLILMIAPIFLIMPLLAEYPKIGFLELIVMFICCLWFIGAYAAWVSYAIFWRGSAAPIRFARFSARKNIRLADALATDTLLDVSKLPAADRAKHTFATKLAIKAQLYELNLEKKSRVVIEGILCFFVNVLQAFFGLLFFLPNIINHGSISGWSFSILTNKWSLMLAVLLFVVEGAYSIYTDKRLEKRGKSLLAEAGATEAKQQ